VTRKTNSRWRLAFRREFSTILSLAPMPFYQNSARKIRRHIITYADVCRANDATTTELENLGFWSERLEKIEV
jgi:hypothetical protein